MALVKKFSADNRSNNFNSSAIKLTEKLSTISSLDQQRSDQANNSHAKILNQVSSSQTQAKKVMSDLNRLSQNFADSFHDIEGRVEVLSGQLNEAKIESQCIENEKQQLQTENAKINNRLNHLLEILPSGVVLIGKDGVVCECNEVAIEMLGRPLLGEIWLSVIARAFAPKADDGHQVSLKDGRKIHIETKAISPEPGQLIVLTDMTKTRVLQDELSQKQKLSSMGKMIASLAHQIRTPLSAAMIYGSHINNDDLDVDKKNEFASNLMERLRFMDRQIHDMLQFVRGERKQTKEINLFDFAMALKQNMEIFKSVSLESPFITGHCFDSVLKSFQFTGSQDDLIGAIDNLINNAVSATQNKIDSERKISVSFNIPNYRSLSREKTSFLELEVVDNGDGMSEEQQAKVFEPFYSTKNKGNGLGLSIVRGVIIEHAGKLTLDSERNIGSKFKISLPIQKIEATKSNSGIKPKVEIKSSTKAKVSNELKANHPATQEGE